MTETQKQIDWFQQSIEGKTLHHGVTVGLYTDYVDTGFQPLEPGLSSEETMKRFNKMIENVNKPLQ